MIRWFPLLQYLFETMCACEVSNERLPDLVHSSRPLSLPDGLAYVLIGVPIVAGWKALFGQD